MGWEDIIAIMDAADEPEKPGSYKNVKLSRYRKRRPVFPAGRAASIRATLLARRQVPAAQSDAVFQHLAELIT